MRTTGILITLLAVMVGLFGCAAASLDKQIIGKYGVELDTSAVKAEDKQQADMAKAFLGNMAIEFKEGNKATISAMGTSDEGTWKVEGNNITITSSKGGKPMSLKSNDGGKTLEAVMTEEEAKSTKGLKIKFKKQDK